MPSTDRFETASQIEGALRRLGTSRKAQQSHRYFRAGLGEYGEGDRFLGLTVPQTRSICVQARQLPLEEIKKLLRSPWHECRLAALMIMSGQSVRGDLKTRQRLARAFLAQRKFVNNWDLVDSSAEHVLGHWYFERWKREPRVVLEELKKLSRSRSLWDRRIAMLTTFHFIRQQEFRPTLEIAELLLGDSHDLIHKASGWMLREMGNRNPRPLKKFLDRHAHHMPRTMLRYALERRPAGERKRYMAMKGASAKRAKVERPAP